MVIEPMLPGAATRPAIAASPTPAAYDEATAELVRRGAGRVAHGKGTLLHHLTGTLTVLRAWEQPGDVCVAGLLHSVYSTDAFATPLFEVEKRDELRALAGSVAERLVFLFCSVRRGELFMALETAAADDAMVVHDRTTNEPHEISAREAGDLLVLYMANSAEQACRSDGSPGAWIADLSRLARLARHRATVPPPVLDRGTADVPAIAELRLVDAYAAYLEAPLHEGGAAQRLRSASAAVPWMGEPLVGLGILALGTGDVAAARAYGQRAQRAFAEWATSWDKRLSFERWTGWAACLGAADGTAAARLRTLAGARSVAQCLGIPGAGRRVETQASSLPPRFAQYMAGFRDNEKRTGMGKYPGLTARPWHVAASIPLARELERMAPRIIDEFRSLDPARFHAETENIGREGAWDIMLLHERGRRIDENCSLAPITTQIVESYRSVRSLAGLVYFSRLAPHSRVAAHRGPTNMRLRCHLGIDVPSGCGIKVGGLDRTWEEGKCIVFDDFFTHEVWNDSDRERVVLIVDLWHPDLSDDEVKLLEGLHRYVGTYARNLQSYWGKNEAARRAAATR